MKSLRKTTRLLDYLGIQRTALLFAFGFAGASVCAIAAEPVSSHPARALWLQPQPPLKIFGNTYYVGTRGISVVLITSERGHVLIDGALPESASDIAANIRSLGFRVEDIELILTSHAHSDHVGGIAELQKLSGARVLSSPEGAAALKQGHGSNNDPQFELGDSFSAISNVHTISDGQTARVGDVEMTVHYTPGHTPGGTSWTWRSCEAQRCFNLVYADSLNAVSDDAFRYSGDARYPEARADLDRSMKKIASLACDILISAHPELSRLWERAELHNAGTTDAWVDSAGCRDYAAGARKRLEAKLASEKSDASR